MQTNTFHEMIFKSGLVKPGSDFVLAFDENGSPIKMRDLTSLGIGGFPGAGKTVTTLVLMLEAIIKFDGHVRFLIADPHMYVDGDQSLVSKVYPLSNFFLKPEEIAATLGPEDRDYKALLNRLSLPNPTVGGEELKNWMKIVEMEMGRRLKGKKGETWVVVIDEFAAVMSDEKTAKPVAWMLESMNRQARKFGMFSLLISQNWKASRSGGSELRDSIASFAVMRMPESVAKLIVPDDVARQAETLQNGEVLLYSNGATEQSGLVPKATVEDAELVAHIFSPAQPYSRVSIQEVQDDIYDADATQKLILGPVFEPLKHELPDAFMQSEMAEIRRLYLSGLSEKSIATKVYGAKSGPELEEAMIEVRERLKWMVENVEW